MSNIQKAFAQGKAFIPFITAGDPNLEQTKEFIIEMERAGADLIEIGIPFSDPIAEGIVIQEADLRALKAGTTTDKIFAMVKEIREMVQIPLVFMTYLNPVFHYGYECFFGKCGEAGIDGIIIPDLPFEEKKELVDIATAHHVDVISMMVPTSENRIRKIAQEAKGFIYAMPSQGIAAKSDANEEELCAFLEALKKVTNVPVCTGVGINLPEQAAGFVDGMIADSAVVELVEKHGRQAGAQIGEYIRRMKASISR